MPFTPEVGPSTPPLPADPTVHHNTGAHHANARAGTLQEHTIGLGRGGGLHAAVQEHGCGHSALLQPRDSRIKVVLQRIPLLLLHIQPLLPHLFAANM